MLHAPKWTCRLLVVSALHISLLFRGMFEFIREIWARMYKLCLYDTLCFHCHLMWLMKHVMTNALYTCSAQQVQVYICHAWIAVKSTHTLMHSKWIFCINEVLAENSCMHALWGIGECIFVYLITICIRYMGSTGFSQKYCEPIVLCIHYTCNVYAGYNMHVYTSYTACMHGIISTNKSIIW